MSAIQLLRQIFLICLLGIDGSSKRDLVSLLKTKGLGKAWLKGTASQHVIADLKIANPLT